MTIKRRWAARIGGTLFAVAAINFIAFFVHGMAMGGSAGNGKREDGRYYLGDHGHYTEVTEREWRRMRAHEITVFVTHPLAIFVGGPLLTYANRRRHS